MSEEGHAARRFRGKRFRVYRVWGLLSPVNLWEIRGPIRIVWCWYGVERANKIARELEEAYEPGDTLSDLQHILDNSHETTRDIYDSPGD